MDRQLTNISTVGPQPSDARGFTVVELLVVAALLATVALFAIMSIQRSRETLNLAGTARTLSAYLEQARVDAVRHHGGASVVINSSSSYTANIDFGETGTPTARAITLPPGMTISYTLPPSTTSVDPSVTPLTIQYDWRGRTASTVTITLTDAVSGVPPSTLVVGFAGDISVDTTVTGPVVTPTPQTAVTTTAGIKNMSGN